VTPPRLDSFFSASSPSLNIFPFLPCLSLLDPSRADSRATVPCSVRAAGPCSIARCRAAVLCSVPRRRAMLPSRRSFHGEDSISSLLHAVGSDDGYRRHPAPPPPAPSQFPCGGLDLVAPARRGWRHPERPAAPRASLLAAQRRLGPSRVDSHAAALCSVVRYGHDGRPEFGLRSRRSCSPRAATSDVAVKVRIPHLVEVGGGG
jgi:hypothetical protein